MFSSGVDLFPYHYLLYLTLAFPNYFVEALLLTKFLFFPWLGDIGSLELEKYLLSMAIRSAKVFSPRV